MRVKKQKSVQPLDSLLNRSKGKRGKEKAVIGQESDQANIRCRDEGEFICACLCGNRY